MAALRTSSLMKDFSEQISLIRRLALVDTLPTIKFHIREVPAPTRNEFQLIQSLFS